ncbi:hypothetical protein JHK87_014191 [Glycine soja]|nr:hypothetical protein JHK87_014191 [Glycine soja]KAG5044902.1 hypothetical protein JHK86_014308 [Glycine max]
MRDQFRGPYRSTSPVRIRSSSALHGPLILSGLLGLDSEEQQSEEEEVEEELLLVASILLRKT